MIDKLVNTTAVALAAFGILAVLSGFFAIITMWTWNFVIPFVFHLPHINLFQAFALNILSGILIKSTTTGKL